MPDEIYLTKDGLATIQQELEELTNVKRPAVIARIKAAKELGDLSENADYHDAKEVQGFIEGRIKELEHIVSNAKVISKNNSGNVQVGNKVKVLCDGQEREFSIVGASETDPTQNKISHESPIGRALIGHKVGDMVDVQIPKGIMKCEIIEIT
ncbi:MAG: transcription elongation factor GreA [Candidatus Buchananbacteria bacterium CG10_big_fil_rev_8_21_14_0_10_42_9]|uniref:Transcription elongation factor GreA n=1 Tax=Candidatus Buchananbacteria bacterium CG10_big_fil_rev_8_21_14_0_10_42_9 TaxID=1974526 RepID=A0A2H0W4E5_9BACT|nr:MAG: transcription elongation factor GreA [Candidatus Buchananbacteria bacterium CG10_big_fil_rev_8_21_14_0_10_42_9]